MKINELVKFFFLFIAISLTGCDFIGDVFEFGFWVAIIVIVIIVLIIMGIIRFFRRR